MSYIVESGSKQYIVELGQQIIVDRLKADENENVELKVLFSFNGDAEQKTLAAKVVKHQKGEKIRVVKFKSKSNYHRQYGHRAYETVLEILDPSGKSVKPAKAAKAEKTEEAVETKMDKKESKTVAKTKVAKTVSAGKQAAKTVKTKAVTKSKAEKSE